jgi:hypothetical protein
MSLLRKHRYKWLASLAYKAAFAALTSQDGSLRSRKEAISFDGAKEYFLRVARLLAGFVGLLRIGEPMLPTHQIKEISFNARPYIKNAGIYTPALMREKTTYRNE